MKHSFLCRKVFFRALYYVLLLHPFFDYYHVTSLALSNHDVLEKRYGLAIGRNMSNNNGIVTNRVKWERLSRRTFLEDSPQRKSIKTFQLSRPSNSENNDNFYDKSQQNFFFQFVLAGDRDIEQIKSCCAEQLKGGVLTTIDAVVHEIDALILEQEAFSVNIDNLEGKIIRFHFTTCS